MSLKAGLGLLEIVVFDDIRGSSQQYPWAQAAVVKAALQLETQEAGAQRQQHVSAGVESLKAEVARKIDSKQEPAFAKYAYDFAASHDPSVHPYMTLL